MIPYITTAEAKSNWRDKSSVRINKFEAEPVTDPKPFTCEVCGEKVAVKPTADKPCVECGGCWK